LNLGKTKRWRENSVYWLENKNLQDRFMAYTIYKVLFYMVIYLSCISN
jgi:hypothetical protein